MTPVKTTYYSGYLLLDSGYKLKFDDISEDEMNTELLEAYNNMVWEFKLEDIIWLSNLDLSIPACRVIGFSIREVSN